MWTLPKLNTVVSFLSAYDHKPSLYHLTSELYALQYFQSTLDLGINFSSSEATEPHAQIQNTFPHYKEAYTNASSPTPDSHHELAAYSEACWVSQV